MQSTTSTGGMRLTPRVRPRDSMKITGMVLPPPDAEKAPPDPASMKALLRKIRDSGALVNPVLLGEVEALVGAKPRAWRPKQNFV